MSKFSSIGGTVALHSLLSIEEVACVLSKNLFGGLEFGGKDKFIYEEVPALFISSLILGMRVILAQGNNNTYSLELIPEFQRERNDSEIINGLDISGYLCVLLKSQVENMDFITLV